MMPIPRRMKIKKRKRPRRPLISFSLWHNYMIILLLLFNLQPSPGLEIFSSTVSPTHAAVGGNVTLRYHFNLAPQDTGVLDIEWSIKPADTNLPETLVIWYAANRIFGNCEVFGSRVRFVSPNPANGNASISIDHLKMTDTNTYQCKVRKLPGIQSHIIHMNVMQRPTEPECYVEGVVELDCRVVFRCRSSQGSQPMWYRWSMDDRSKRLPSDSIVDSSEGDLLLTITKEVAPGNLVCTAQNQVGMESCLVAVSFENSAVVAISAAVAGLTAFIIITVLVFCSKRRNFSKGETFGNELLEDELPPHKWMPKKNPRAGPPSIPRKSGLQDQEEPKRKQVGKGDEKNDLYVEMNDLYVEMVYQSLYEETLV